MKVNQYRFTFLITIMATLTLSVAISSTRSATALTADNISSGEFTSNEQIGSTTAQAMPTLNNSQVTLNNKIYWTDTTAQKIQRANLDGSNVEDIITGLGAPYGFAVDAAGGKLYWANPGAAKIQRANLDGSNVEDVITSDLSFPYGVTVDTTDGKIYWTDDGTNKIQRANLDGSIVEDLVTAGLGTPIDIAVDNASGKIYWTDQGTDKVQRANLDGSDVEDVITGLSSPFGVGVDTKTGKLYWADWGIDKIQRANLDGSNIKDVIIGSPTPLGVVIDSSAGHIYWADNGTDKIQRANLDGTAVEDIVASGLTTPAFVALAFYADIEEQTVIVEFAGATSSGIENIANPNLLTLTTSDSKVTTQNITLELAVSGGTLTDDYIVTTPFTILAGTASGTLFAVPGFAIVDDDLIESDETLTLTLSNPSGTVLGTQTSTDYTIQDNDTAGINVSPFSNSLDEAVVGTTANYTYQPTTAISGNVVVDLTPDSQCTVAPTQVTIVPNGSNIPSAVTVTATVVDDTIIEGAHTCVISATVNAGLTADANYELVSINDATVNIADDDAPGVSVNPTTGLTVSEAGLTDTFDISLNTTPTGVVTIQVTPDDQCTVNGNTIPITLDFNDTNPQTVTVGAVDDAVVEGDHTCTLTNNISASDAAEYPTSFNVDNVTVDITDNQVQIYLPIIIRAIREFSQS